MEAHPHPSTLLSMDSSASSSHDELDLELNPLMILSRPPDINLPLSAERSPPPPLHNSWNPDQFGILDESKALLNVPKARRKFAKRVDCTWGAWFFFSFYFNPVVNKKSKPKIVRDREGVSGFDKSDLMLDVFMIQHDMENMYMWVFRGRPENALSKMHLKSYMNGHTRHGERPFPYFELHRITRCRGSLLEITTPKFSYCFMGSRKFLRLS
ncbi:hypothetical protein MLD38_024954 [Melastoma candidum]|uniref:Uncharacterized protein n=1 Tax=Melastoma candidum TaxID=119954 RepID=A0ACB9NWR4_9MYRT|nr:hypothetical protein MLD38_024954 [Melastoma candidum]